MAILHQKPVLFSGVQPSGIIHIGNYFGALTQWVKMQDDHDSLFSVVDLHAITVLQSPDDLKKHTLATAKILLSIGIDPRRAVLFAQSQVSSHAELAWILGTVTKMSELELMTQFKDKARKKEKNGAGVGLFVYPVLMAADILLYKTAVVPVGEDQTQHIELTRELARRFNALFGKTFLIPKAIFPAQGARIMSLSNPLRKMSKSDFPDSYVSLLDSPEAVSRKVRRAVTDSGDRIEYDPKRKPGVSNLLLLLSLASGKSISSLEKTFVKKTYANLKEDVAVALNKILLPIQKKYASFSDKETEKILSEGARQAIERSEKIISEVKHKMGLG